ncbi:hypothetical protein WJX73_001899 [Symbiochloris irregularis]|uniref:Mitochondrial carrier protein n=1 Tax=Symbiochloris irregularis TaxID=706552 RepID=A0AAW1NV75_9CHLO
MCLESTDTILTQIESSESVPLCCCAYYLLRPRLLNWIAGGSDHTKLSLQTEQSVPSVPDEDNGRAIKLLVSGGAAGAISRTVTAPIDRLKFLMQVSSTSKLTLGQGLARMAAERSPKAYFRGNGTNVLKNVPETALKLTLNDRVKSLVLKDGHHMALWERLVIGGLSGGIAQALIYPLEVIQAHLATTSGAYTGIMDVVRQLVHRDGYRSLYRGITPCLLGIVPYAGVDITLFEVVKEKLVESHGGQAPGPHLLLLTGMTSSSIAQTMAYPLGLIRTRLAIDGQGGQPRMYTGMLDCLRRTWAKEGLMGFYKGWSMSLAKVAPAAGISWLIFEEGKVVLHCPDVHVH